MPGGSRDADETGVGGRRSIEGGSATRIHSLLTARSHGQWAFGDASGARRQGRDRRLGHRRRSPDGRQGRRRRRGGDRPRRPRRYGISFVEGPHEDLYGHGTACAGIVRSIGSRGGDLQRASARGRAHRSGERVRRRVCDGRSRHDMDVVNLSLSTSRGEWYGTFHELVDLAVLQALRRRLRDEQPAHADVSLGVRLGRVGRRSLGHELQSARLQPCRTRPSSARRASTSRSRGRAAAPSR